jgi:hypothetical protein
MEGVIAPGARASAHLLEHKEAIARAVGQALYGEMPWLLDKYGERGRQKCLQDMRYNLEHLAPAVELEAPGMFAGYAVWVDGLLRARNVPTAELARSLELLEAEAGRGMDGEARQVVERCVRTALGALRGGEGAR